VASWQHDIIDSAAAGARIVRVRSAQVLRLIDKERTHGVSHSQCRAKFGIDASSSCVVSQELRLLVLKAAPIAADYGISTEEVDQRRHLLGYSLNDLLRIQNLLVNLEQKIRGSTIGDQHRVIISTVPWKIQLR
jgi:hypothetical protein